MVGLNVGGLFFSFSFRLRHPLHHITAMAHSYAGGTSLSRPPTAKKTFIVTIVLWINTVVGVLSPVTAAGRERGNLPLEFTFKESPELEYA